jgi:site-specific DNA recombinase
MSRARAVGYVRVSTLEQASEGVSIDAQTEKIRTYCSLRDMDLVDMVKDLGVSGGKPLSKRPGGMKVLEMVRSKEVNAVVAVKLDRAFRDAVDCLTVTKEWDKADVAFHVIDLGGTSVDTKSAAGRFMLTVLAGAAEMERNLVRERTTAAMSYKKRNGQRVGNIPFGFKVMKDGVNLKPIKAELKTVNLIYTMRKEGMSRCAIARKLNETKVRTKNRGRWHHTTVDSILKNSIYESHLN